MVMEVPVVISRTRGKAEAKVVGRHVYGNLYDCNPDVLSDEESLRSMVVEAARIGNMTLLDVRSWKIGLGVSVVAIILESHIALHTWPEYRYATLDVYSCGAHTDPEASFNYLVEKLGARYVERRYADRSLE